MTPRTPLRALTLAACTTCIALVAAPAAAAPSPARDGADDAGATTRSKPARPAQSRLRARIDRHVPLGNAIPVRGRLRPGLRGRVIRLQLRTRRGWSTVARTRTGRGGRFKVAWHGADPGRYRLRVRFAGDRRARRAGDRLARTNVYRAGAASWYGPGLYGNYTACGGTLTPSRLGVAHKYLPCGARVTFRYRGRSVTVPVIDRGPFAGAREWDLTAATKARLGFGDIGTVWSTR